MDQLDAPVLTVSLATPSGWLKRWQETIVAPQTSGPRVNGVLVDTGSVAREGQPIVRLFQSSGLADLRKHKAGVETVTVNLAKAEADANCAGQLRKVSLLSDEKIQLRQNTMDQGLITARYAEFGAVAQSGTRRILGDLYREGMASPAPKDLPSSLTLVEQRELQRRSELFESFALAMAISVFCIYAVLVLLFHDVLESFTLLTALALPVDSGLLPLVGVGTSFSTLVVIGLLMLTGVVTMNSILLIDDTIMVRRRGIARFNAFVDSFHKHARPIVLTIVVAGSGMLPVALSLAGGDPSFRQPMVIVATGGAMTSALLSLIVIPVIFTFVDELLQVLKRLIGGNGTQQAIADNKPFAFPDREALAFEHSPAKQSGGRR